MRTKGSSAEPEARRLRAAELLGKGKGTNEVARLVGVTASCVSKGKKALRKRGPAGLRARPQPGRTPRLNGSQTRRLVATIKRGAVAAGYDSDLWTCRRVRDLIGKTFGVRYDFNHVGRILHALGFSVQKPEARARERDETAIQRWRKKDWPRLKETRGG
ncbi:MAG: transposase [Phycisphaerales bacterium]|nr:transposase [Phycisphaerales bacterium]